MLPTAYSPAFLKLFARSLHWEAWEQLIRQNGWTIDRPYRSRHPLFPEIIYPIDYGYINGTRSSDGEPVDLFVGRGHRGLVGAILTIDRRRGKREVKFLYNCTAEEVWSTVHQLRPAAAGGLSGPSLSHVVAVERLG
ncbi:inorganic diphosphatase [Rhodothermus marinus]|uniref:inorganic diphosphatase n=1 Tax=Rhodothermus marinus TaxID=29549 RepID=UPI001FB30712|nr:inorganic diphosphatase [Rhodothermus marinus]